MPGDILIRPYQANDEAAVKALFRSGIESLRPHAFWDVIRSPPIAMPISCSALFVHQVVQHHVGSDPQPPILSFLPVVLSAATVLVPCFFLFTMVTVAIQKYIERCTADDLSSIESVYFSNKGIFLVALDPDTNNIVGIVGGQNRANDQGEGVFELRRMSVDRSYRRRGLGKRLIKTLEVSLPSNRTTIFLTCLSCQRSARALYSSSAFTLTEAGVPSKTAPSWLRAALQYYRFEKYY